MSQETAAAEVLSLWRYPVKSMMGEELNAVAVTERGVLGDRAFALVDAENGKIVSAKNPKKWSHMFHFRAAYVDPPQSGEPIPAVRVTLPDGTTVTSADEDLDRVVSAVLGREVTLKASAPEQPTLEEYWPDVEELDHRDTVTDEAIAAGTFFDGAPIHLLTTATLEALRTAYPDGRFEVRRFRPNVVLACTSQEAGFAEDAWIGRTLRIGDEVRIGVTDPCPRCVMTTLAQGDLPRDTGILRTAAKQHGAHVGVYGKILSGGVIKRGDTAVLED
jgi:uncharacterized protein YcbX